VDLGQVSSRLAEMWRNVPESDKAGTIAINGSYSVILDSVLCMIGPMLCLTHQVPSLACLDKSQLGNILESIVYIMPGL
ncbi:HMG box-containing protein 4-like, partial [Octopus sinensis]|uniref:HMG box-containing protein 4-like n=1 Tax=Octopus sinensis TaxID=2607531 RepID=A0A6P7TYV1_9MOLL